MAKNAKEKAAAKVVVEKTAAKVVVEKTASELTGGVLSVTSGSRENRNTADHNRGGDAVFWPGGDPDLGFWEPKGGWGN